MSWQDALLVYIALGYTVMIVGYSIWIGTMLSDRKKDKKDREDRATKKDPQGPY